MNSEVKCSWASGWAVSPSMSSGGLGGKALENFKISSLKLVWHSPAKIVKVKLSICNCFQFFLGQEERKCKLCKIITLNL